MVHNQVFGPACLALPLILCGLGALPLRAQDPAASRPDEVKAVFRISQEFLNDVIDEEITADIPFRATIVRFHCSGVIHGKGRMSVQMQSGEGQAVFAIDSQGDGHARVTGVRPLIVALGSAWGPFSSRTRVQFDGRQFTYLETVPHVTLHSTLQRVTGRHDRRLGRALGAVARPVGEHLMPRARAQGTPVAEQCLTEFVEDLADRITTRLNERTPVEDSVNRLFPETRDWIFHMSADEEFLQAAYGPPSVAVPELPALPNRDEDVRIEVWLRSTGEGAQALADLSHRPLARQLVQKYLEATLPRLAALAENRSVTAVGDWVVISVGAPPSADTDKLIPETPQIIERILNQ